MNPRDRFPLGLGPILFYVLLAAGPASWAADATGSEAGWHAQSLGQAIGYMLLFALIGVVAAVAGYKVFDIFTPGNLHQEIIQNRNVAAAILGAAVIMGVCLIVAAAMTS